MLKACKVDFMKKDLVYILPTRGIS